MEFLIINISFQKIYLESINLAMKLFHRHFISMFITSDIFERVLY